MLYLVPAVGRVLVDGVQIAAGDGVAVRDRQSIELRALGDAGLVMMELA